MSIYISNNNYYKNYIIGILNSVLLSFLVLLFFFLFTIFLLFLFIFFFFFLSLFLS